MFPVRIQTRKHVLEHGEYMAPTLQHELDHTDQESIGPEYSDKTGIDHTDHLSEVWKFSYMGLTLT